MFLSFFFLMAILEISISLQSEPLLEKQYYSTDGVLDKEIRNSLLQAIYNLANEAFGEEVRSFSLGEYSIVLISHEIGLSLEEEIDQSISNIKKITMHSIINKNSDENTIIKTMNEALFQFTNRFSVNDIFEKRIKKFKKFEKRIDKIFGDLILKSEDRFKSLF